MKKYIILMLSFFLFCCCSSAVKTDDKSQNNFVFHSISVDPNDGEWTLVVIPDTQHYTANWSKAPFRHMQLAFDWIVNHRESLNIQMVQGLGDITENWNSNSEWGRGNEAWSRLEGHVAFMPVVGNHDDPNSFNNWFSTERFEASHGSYWGKAGRTGNQNNYIKIDIGKEKYIFLQIEPYTQYQSYKPEGIRFANEVIANHQNHKIILATHDNWDTHTVRNEILKKWDNISLSNAGHTCVREKRFETKGPKGGTTQNFIVDYQCDSYEIMNLRLYVFRPKEDRVYFYTYSPVTKKFEIDDSSQGYFYLEQKD